MCGVAFIVDLVFHLSTEELERLLMRSMYYLVLNSLGFCFRFRGSIANLGQLIEMLLQRLLFLAGCLFFGGIELDLKSLVLLLKRFASFLKLLPRSCLVIAPV